MSMNFEVLDLQALMAVLDLRSFSLAAARLNMSQPALSRRIQRLEAKLGGPLLERTTRHVAPSVLGQQVLPLLRRALNEMENALDGIEDLGGLDRGWVVVACLQTAVPYFIPPALAAFRAMHPRVRVRILDMTAQEALQSVASGEADFAITLVNAVQNTDLDVQPLLDDPFVLACDAGHALAKRKQLLWRELVDYPVIVTARTSVHRPLIQEALARTGLRLSWSYEVLHMSSAFHLIRAGLGVSVLPRIAMMSAGQSDLRAIPLLEPVIHRPISIVHRRSRPLSPAAQCLAALVHQHREQDSEGC
jgi:DNA-binding transcriptional LysR family regulator